MAQEPTIKDEPYSLKEFETLFQEFEQANNRIEPSKLEGVKVSDPAIDIENDDGAINLNPFTTGDDLASDDYHDWQTLPVSEIKIPSSDDEEDDENKRKVKKALSVLEKALDQLTDSRLKHAITLQFDFEGILDDDGIIKLQRICKKHQIDPVTCFGEIEPEEKEGIEPYEYTPDEYVGLTYLFADQEALTDITVQECDFEKLVEIKESKNPARMAKLVVYDKDVKLLDSDGEPVNLNPYTTYDNIGSQDPSDWMTFTVSELQGDDPATIFIEALEKLLPKIKDNDVQGAFCKSFDFDYELSFESSERVRDLLSKYDLDAEEVFPSLTLTLEPEVEEEQELDEKKAEKPQKPKLYSSDVVERLGVMRQKGEKTLDLSGYDLTSVDFITVFNKAIKDGLKMSEFDANQIDISNSTVTSAQVALLNHIVTYRGGMGKFNPDENVAYEVRNTAQDKALAFLMERSLTTRLGKIHGAINEGYQRT